MRVERAHVRRLLVICGICALLGVPCLFLRIRLGFAALFLLGVLLALGLSGLLSLLRKAGG